MHNRNTTAATGASGKAPEQGLLELLAELDRPLDRRIVDRGYENLRVFLSRPPKSH